MQPRTIIEKVWDNHVVAERAGTPTLLYIDLHLVHEVTSPQAFSGLRERGIKVRRPELTIGTTDHSIPTHDRSLPIIDKIAAAQITQFEKNCQPAQQKPGYRSRDWAGAGTHAAGHDCRLRR
jgi:3-isopropylmalate/(R)-2-methylmalate dehydratase large subunit